MSPLARLLVLLLSGYRRGISPFLGQHCRFAPSCSAYAVLAVQRFGAVRGSWLALRRLLRCHPFNPGGHDPVPLARPTGGRAAVRSLRSSTTLPWGPAPVSPPAVHDLSPKRTGACPC